jgi:hypothetical protein
MLFEITSQLKKEVPCHSLLYVNGKPRTLAELESQARLINDKELLVLSRALKGTVNDLQSFSLLPIMENVFPLEHDQT